MRRRALIFLLSAAALAARTARAQDGGPAAPIARLNEALLEIMRLDHTAPFARRAAVLAPVVEQAFDLTEILQVSVGPRWAAIPQAQKATLLDVFTRYTIASYVANFDSYSGQRFDISPQPRPVGSDLIVETRIVPTSGDATRIDYRMRRSATGWRCVDVLVDGSISRVAVQRSDFRALLASGGAERLIDSLRQKVTSLEAGEKT